LIRYWLTPGYEDGLDEKIADINATYKEAPERAKQGQHTESLDELTGVQALERKHPGLPMCSGKVERREFEYIVIQKSFFQRRYKIAVDSKDKTKDKTRLPDEHS
jgi:hypothetical protein